MSEFVIIPDTACDLTKDLRERFGIHDYLRGVLYFPDGHQELADLDWNIIDPETFYKSMSDKKTLYKTASPVLGDVIEIFEKNLKAGKDILCICLSSGLSGTHQICEMAKAQLADKYPERKIVCVDSMRYSTALSLLVIMAAEKKNEGATLDQTVEYIEQQKHCIHQMGPMDDLFFLCKTGRISNFKAFFGTLMGINSVADFNDKGMAEVLGKFKGKKAALDATIKYMRKTVENPQDQIIFIAHSIRPEAAELLAKMVKDEFSPKEIIINNVGMACGASIGPGLCAVFYRGKKISENCEEEKAVMAAIIES